MAKLFAGIALMVLGLALSACQKEGPAERTGKEIDKAMDRATDSVKEATKSK